MNSIRNCFNFLTLFVSDIWANERINLFELSTKIVSIHLVKKIRFVDNSKWRTSIIGAQCRQLLLKERKKGRKKETCSFETRRRNRISCWTDITVYYFRQPPDVFLNISMRYKLSRSLYVYNLNQCTLEDSISDDLKTWAIRLPSDDTNS